MYTYYYSTGACSLAGHALLEECKAPYTAKMIRLSKGEGQTPEYLAKNPLGQVPCLEDGNFTLCENLAIYQYLFEKYPSCGWFPKDAQQRAKMWQWLSFLNSTVHPYFWGTFSPGKFAGTPDAVKAWSSENVTKYFNFMEKQLGTTKFLAGDTCSLADVLLCVMSKWCANVQPTYTCGPNVTRVCQYVEGLPSWKKAWETEQSAKSAAEAKAA